MLSINSVILNRLILLKILLFLISFNLLNIYIMKVWYEALIPGINRIIRYNTFTHLL